MDTSSTLYSFAAEALHGNPTDQLLAMEDAHRELLHIRSTGARVDDAAVAMLIESILREFADWEVHARDADGDARSRAADAAASDVDVSLQKQEAAIDLADSCLFFAIQALVSRDTRSVLLEYLDSLTSNWMFARAYSASSLSDMHPTEQCEDVAGIDPLPTTVWAVKDDWSIRDRNGDGARARRRIATVMQQQGGDEAAYALLEASGAEQSQSLSLRARVAIHRALRALGFVGMGGEAEQRALLVSRGIFDAERPPLDLLRNASLAVTFVSLSVEWLIAAAAGAARVQAGETRLAEDEACTPRAMDSAEDRAEDTSSAACELARALLDAYERLLCCDVLTVRVQAARALGSIATCIEPADVVVQWMVDRNVLVTIYDTHFHAAVAAQATSLFVVLDSAKGEHAAHALAAAWHGARQLPATDARDALRALADAAAKTSSRIIAMLYMCAAEEDPLSADAALISCLDALVHAGREREREERRAVKSRDAAVQPAVDRSSEGTRVQMDLTPVEGAPEQERGRGPTQSSVVYVESESAPPADFQGTVATVPGEALREDAERTPNSSHVERIGREEDDPSAPASEKPEPIVIDEPFGQSSAASPARGSGRDRDGDTQQPPVITVTSADAEMTDTGAHVAKRARTVSPERASPSPWRTLAAHVALALGPHAGTIAVRLRAVEALTTLAAPDEDAEDHAVDTAVAALWEEASTPSVTGEARASKSSRMLAASFCLAVLTSSPSRIGGAVEAVTCSLGTSIADGMRAATAGLLAAARALLTHSDARRHVSPDAYAALWDALRVRDAALGNLPHSLSAPPAAWVHTRAPSSPMRFSSPAVLDNGPATPSDAAAAAAGGGSGCDDCLCEAELFDGYAADVLGLHSALDICGAGLWLVQHAPVGSARNALVGDRVPALACSSLTPAGAGILASVLLASDAPEDFGNTVYCAALEAHDTETAATLARALASSGHKRWNDLANAFIEQACRSVASAAEALVAGVDAMREALVATERGGGGASPAPLGQGILIAVRFVGRTLEPRTVAASPSDRVGALRAELQRLAGASKRVRLISCGRDLPDDSATLKETGVAAAPHVYVIIPQDAEDCASAQTRDGHEIGQQHTADRAGESSTPRDTDASRDAATSPASGCDESGDVWAAGRLPAAPGLQDRLRGSSDGATLFRTVWGITAGVRKSLLPGHVASRLVHTLCSSPFGSSALHVRALLARAALPSSEELRGLLGRADAERAPLAAEYILRAICTYFRNTDLLPPWAPEIAEAAIAVVEQVADFFDRREILASRVHAAAAAALALAEIARLSSLHHDLLPDMRARRFIELLGRLFAASTPFADGGTVCGARLDTDTDTCNTEIAAAVAELHAAGAMALQRLAAVLRQTVPAADILGACVDGLNIWPLPPLAVDALSKAVGEGGAVEMLARALWHARTSAPAASACAGVLGKAGKLAARAALEPLLRLAADAVDAVAEHGLRAEAAPNLHGKDEEALAARCAAAAEAIRASALLADCSVQRRAENGGSSANTSIRHLAARLAASLLQEGMLLPSQTGARPLLRGASVRRAAFACAARALALEHKLEGSASMALSPSDGEGGVRALREAARNAADEASRLRGISEAFVPPHDAGWYIDAASLGRAIRGPAGLVNLGCTCYMNSVLQSLFAIREMRCFVYGEARACGDERSMDVDRSDANERPSEGPEPAERDALRKSEAAKAMASAFASLGATDRRSFTPTALIDAYVSPSGERVNPSVQADADEFLQGLVAQLGDPQIVRAVVQRTTTPLDDASASSSVEEELVAVPVDVAAAPSLAEALDAFTRDEILHGANMYWSDVLKRHVAARRRARFARLPHVLAFHFKRFEFNLTTMERRKVDDRASFPALLDMAPYATAEAAAHGAQYRLAGVVLHGGTALSGHYVALVAHTQPGSNRRTWLRCDDSIITEFKPEDMPRAAFGGNRTTGQNASMSAYMLFYERCGAAVASGRAAPPCDASNPDVGRSADADCGRAFAHAQDLGLLGCESTGDVTRAEIERVRAAFAAGSGARSDSASCGSAEEPVGDDDEYRNVLASASALDPRRRGCAPPSERDANLLAEIPDALRRAVEDDNRDFATHCAAFDEEYWLFVRTLAKYGAVPIGTALDVFFGSVLRVRDAPDAQAWIDTLQVAIRHDVRALCRAIEAPGTAARWIGENTLSCFDASARTWAFRCLMMIIRALREADSVPDSRLPAEHAGTWASAPQAPSGDSRAADTREPTSGNGSATEASPVAADDLRDKQVAEAAQNDASCVDRAQHPAYNTVPMHETLADSVHENAGKADDGILAYRDRSTDDTPADSPSQSGEGTEHEWEDTSQSDASVNDSPAVSEATCALNALHTAPRARVDVRGTAAALFDTVDADSAARTLLDAWRGAFPRACDRTPEVIGDFTDLLAELVHVRPRATAAAVHDGLVDDILAIAVAHCATAGGAAPNRVSASGDNEREVGREGCGAAPRDGNGVRQQDFAAMEPFGAVRALRIALAECAERDTAPVFAGAHRALTFPLDQLTDALALARSLAAQHSGTGFAGGRNGAVTPRAGVADHAAHAACASESPTQRREEKAPSPAAQSVAEEKRVCSSASSSPVCDEDNDLVMVEGAETRADGGAVQPVDSERARGEDRAEAPPRSPAEGSPARRGNAAPNRWSALDTSRIRLHTLACCAVAHAATTASAHGIADFARGAGLHAAAVAAAAVRAPDGDPAQRLCDALVVLDAAEALIAVILSPESPAATIVAAADTMVAVSNRPAMAFLGPLLSTVYDPVLQAWQQAAASGKPAEAVAYASVIGSYADRSPALVERIAATPRPVWHSLLASHVASGNDVHASALCNVLCAAVSRDAQFASTWLGDDTFYAALTRFAIASTSMPRTAASLWHAIGARLAPPERRSGDEVDSPSDVAGTSEPAWKDAHAVAAAVLRRAVADFGEKAALPTAALFAHIIQTAPPTEEMLGVAFDIVRVALRDLDASGLANATAKLIVQLARSCVSAPELLDRILHVLSRVMTQTYAPLTVAIRNLSDTAVLFRSLCVTGAFDPLRHHQIACGSSLAKSAYEHLSDEDLRSLVETVQVEIVMAMSALDDDDGQQESLGLPTEINETMRSALQALRSSEGDAAAFVASMLDAVLSS